MDDSRRFWALLAVSVYMTHHVVTHLALPLLRHGIVDVVLVRLQLGNLLVCDSSPSFCSARAKAIHSRRQVRNLSFLKKYAAFPDLRTG